MARIMASCSRIDVFERSRGAGREMDAQRRDRGVDEAIRRRQVAIVAVAEEAEVEVGVEAVV